MGLTATVPPFVAACLLFAGCTTPPRTELAGPVTSAPGGPVIVESEGLLRDLQTTRAFLEGRPTYEQPLVADLEPVPGLTDLSAKTCAACHPDIAAEWAQSVHSQAWVDPQFQAEIGKSGNRWLCLNCHTPLLQQQDLWPRALVDGDVERPILAANPSFDPALRDEGVTCAGCHVRDGVIVGPGLGGDAPHPVQVDEGLRSGAACERCHQAQASYEGKPFVCVFDTGEEWRASPYAAEEGRTCVGCHMPTVQRPAAVGGPVRTVARHWWRGAGIPKIPGRYPPPEANAPGLDVQARLEGREIAVRMSNAAAGHRLPTGDPERWISVELVFHGADGADVGRWSHRIGQVWEWEPEPRKLSDNRLLPGQTSVHRVPVPSGAVAAELTASSWRISEENAAYHHLGDYPRGVVTHVQTVPIAR